MSFNTTISAQSYEEMIEYCDDLYREQKRVVGEDQKVKYIKRPKDIKTFFAENVLNFLFIDESSAARRLQAIVLKEPKVRIELNGLEIKALKIAPLERKFLKVAAAAYAIFGLLTISYSIYFATKAPFKNTISLIGFGVVLIAGSQYILKSKEVVTHSEKHLKFLKKLKEIAYKDQNLDLQINS